MFGLEFWNSGGGLITIVFIATLWLTAVATYSYRKKMQRKGLEPEPKERRPSKWNWRFWSRNRGPPRDVPEVQEQGVVMSSSLQRPEEKVGTVPTAIPEELEDVEVVIKDQEEKVAALPKVARKAVVAKIAHDVKRGQEEGGRVREAHPAVHKRPARIALPTSKKLEDGGLEDVQEDHP